MITTRLRQVRRLFTNDLTPRETQRANMLKWVRSVRWLGHRWNGLEQSAPKKVAA